MRSSPDASLFLWNLMNIRRPPADSVDRLPEDVSLLGIYAYGEYCPERGNKTGTSYNLFHNFTFTIMAL